MESDGMIIEARINNLSELKRKLLDADMLHTKYILLDEMKDSIEKLKGDRNAMFRIVRMLARVSTFSDLTVESMIMNLEHLTAFDIMTYSLSHDGTVSILTMSVNDEYFEIFDKIPMVGRYIGMLSGGRKKFVSEVEKTLRDDYTKDFTVEEKLAASSSESV
jgi:hypothetical protein